MKVIFWTEAFALFLVAISTVASLQGQECRNITIGEAAHPKRLRRYLGFKQGTRVFLRVNIKDNVIKINQIWAHAYGFRQNFDIPYPVPKSYKVRRRDVHETLETLINQHGFDGRACILRSFCEASKIATPESGMFFKLFKRIFTNPTPSDDSNSLPDGDEKAYPYLTSENCDELRSHCPLNLLDVVTYTDI